jgi:hypothetical protein
MQLFDPVILSFGSFFGGFNIELDYFEILSNKMKTISFDNTSVWYTRN